MSNPNMNNNPSGDNYSNRGPPEGLSSRWHNLDDPQAATSLWRDMSDLEEAMQFQGIDPGVLLEQVGPAPIGASNGTFPATATTTTTNQVYSSPISQLGPYRSNPNDYNPNVAGAPANIGRAPPAANGHWPSGYLPPNAPPINAYPYQPGMATLFPTTGPQDGLNAYGASEPGFGQDTYNNGGPGSMNMVPNQQRGVGGPPGPGMMAPPTNTRRRPNATRARARSNANASSPDAYYRNKHHVLMTKEEVVALNLPPKEIAKFGDEETRDRKVKKPIWLTADQAVTLNMRRASRGEKQFLPHEGPKRDSLEAAARARGVS